MICSNEDPGTSKSLLRKKTPSPVRDVKSNERAREMLVIFRSISVMR